MLHAIFSAVALAGILTAAQPAFADPLAATAADHAQTAASATEQPVSPPAAASAERGKDFIPVGFGWG